jgi:pimeloyl-ACP methyl ester carboxylesterase
MKTKTVINGISLAYEDCGAGAPLLLIHGFPLSRRIWAPQITALSNKFRIIAPDLRGFGESDAPEGPYSMELFSNDLISLLDHLGIAQTAACGMSMGGYVLLNLLERYPERITAACFMVTKGGGDDEAGKERRTLLAREALAKGAQAVAEPFSQILFVPGGAEKRPALFDEILQIMLGTSPQGLAGGLLAMRERKDYTDYLGGFRIPSLVIGAGLDKAIPPEESRKLAAALPDAKLVIVPDAGHMAGMEQPEAVNSALLSFLESLPTG